MTELRLALLGPPAVLRDGLSVTFDTRKAVALLALLAVTGREHSREQLADLLWPEAGRAKGRASLRRTLSVTAAAMASGLTISRAAVTLDLAAVQVDVREFEALIGRADAESLERAAQLYRDDFLSGFVLRGCPDFEEWQASVSEGLRQALARGLQRLVTACIDQGDLERATGHARRWLALDPLHDPAHQAIIRLHGWAGQRSAAMRQYRWLVRVLDRDLAVRPLPETTRLYDDVRAGRLGPPPAPSVVRPAEPPAAADAALAAAAAVEVPDGAGAAGIWPLVGREAELAALRAAWRATGTAGRGGAGGGEGGRGQKRADARRDPRVPARGAAPPAAGRGAARPLPRRRDRAAVRAGRGPAADHARGTAGPARGAPGADGRDGGAPGAGPGRGAPGLGRARPGQPGGRDQAIRRHRRHAAGRDPGRGRGRSGSGRGGRGGG